MAGSGSGRDGHGVPARLRGTVDIHKGPVHVARLNEAGRYLLTGGADRQVHLFNAASMASGSSSSSYGGDATDASSSPPIKTYAAHSGAVLGLSIAHDNATFVSGGEDRNVLVWDVASGSVVRRLSAHTGAIQTVVLCGAAPSSGGGGGLSSGDTVLAAAGFDTVLRFYDLRARGAWKPIMECKNARDAILSMAIKGHTAYTGSVDGVVRTYDMRAGELYEDTIDRPVTSLTTSAAGTTLLVSVLGRPGMGSSGSDTGARSGEHATHILLDLSDGSHLQTIKQAGANVSYRCHSTLCGGDDATILAGDEQGCVRAWDVLSGSEARIPEIGSGSPVGKDVPRSLSTTDVPPHRKAVLWTEYSSKDGGKMVTAGADGAVKVWSAT